MIDTSDQEFRTANERPPSILRRIAANLVDSIILIIPVLLLLFTLSPVVDDWGDINRNNATASALVLFAVSIYEVVGIKIWGTTLGKQALRISVVALDDGPLTWAASIKRYVVKTLQPFLIVIVFSSLPGANTDVRSFDYFYATFILLTIRFSATRRGWHDKFAGVQVVRTESRPAESSVATMRRQPDRRGFRV